MSATAIPLDTGDFRLIDRKVADVFLKMREHNRFLRGMSGWMGFDAVPIEFVRNERFAGKTKYTLKKMIRLAMDGIIGFSDRPLTLCGGRVHKHHCGSRSYRAHRACLLRSQIPRMAVGS